MSYQCVFPTHVLVRTHMHTLTCTHIPSHVHITHPIHMQPHEQIGQSHIHSLLHVHMYTHTFLHVYIPMQHCASRGQDWNCTLVHYYERLAHYQTSGDTITLQTLQNIFTQIQVALVPPTLLKEWAEHSPRRQTFGPLENRYNPSHYTHSYNTILNEL